MAGNDVSFNSSYSPSSQTYMRDGYKAYVQANSQAVTKDVNEVCNYLAGVPKPEKDKGPFGDGGWLMWGLPGIMGGVQLIMWLIGALKGEGGFAKALADQRVIFNNEKGEVRGRFNDLSAGKFSIKKFLNHYNLKEIKETIPSDEKLAKLTGLATVEGKNNASKAFEAYDKAKKLIITANENADGAKPIIKEIKQLITEGNALSHGLIKSEKGFGKFLEGLKKFSGFSFVSGGIKKLMVKSPAIAESCRFMKSQGGILAGLMLISPVMSLIQAFHLGPNNSLSVDKGVAQIPKSAIQVGAAMGGWALGEKIVKRIIEFAFPGMGTVIGGVAQMFITMGGGQLMSWGLEKITSSWTKNEADIAKEKQANELAQAAIQDPAKLQELLVAAQQKLQQDNSEEAQEAKVAFGSLTKILGIDPTNQDQSQTVVAQNDTNIQNTANTTDTQGNTGINPFDPKTGDIMAANTDWSQYTKATT